jgi:hypothetical protein
LVGTGLAEDLVDDADTLLEADALILDFAELEAFALDLADTMGLPVDFALTEEAFEAWEEISEWAVLDNELRLGEETGIFDAEEDLDGEAVGLVEGLLGVTELEEDLTADLLAAFDEIAETR